MKLIFIMAECRKDGNKENQELQEIIIAEIKRIHGTHKAAEADSITSTLAKKHGLSYSEVAITLQFLVASRKILKRAREGDTDSLVFPKEKKKKPEKVSTKKKLTAQKGNSIPVINENFEVQESTRKESKVQETNLTVVIGDLVRSLNLTNELLQKERDFSKRLLLENNSLKVAMNEKEFENSLGNSDPLQKLTKPSSLMRIAEKRRTIPKAPFVDLEKSEDNKILLNAEWPFLSSSNNKRKNADNNTSTEWSTITKRKKAHDEKHSNICKSKHSKPGRESLTDLECLSMKKHQHSVKINPQHILQRCSDQGTTLEMSSIERISQRNCVESLLHIFWVTP